MNRGLPGSVRDGEVSFGDVFERRLLSFGDNAQKHPAQEINRTRTYTWNFRDIREYYKIVHIYREFTIVFL